jgi:hypothetical protein
MKRAAQLLSISERGFLKNAFPGGNQNCPFIWIIGACSFMLWGYIHKKTRERRMRKSMTHRSCCVQISLERPLEGAMGAHIKMVLRENHRFARTETQHRTWGKAVEPIHFAFKRKHSHRSFLEKMVVVLLLYCSVQWII